MQSFSGKAVRKVNDLWKGNGMLMNIATALNRKYLEYTAVMLTSLCENNPQEQIHAYLLHHELTGEDIQTISEALEAYEIEVISMKVDEELFGERLPRNTQWSVEMYYRLLLMELLPEEVERILYLDVDIIVNQSIQSFYEREFGQNELIVCENAGGYIDTWERLTDRQKKMFGPMFEKGFKYFNSGVMLMNIGKMRNEYNFHTYMKAIEEWNYEMVAPDQDILNYVHWQNVIYEDAEKYNFFARIAHESGFDYEKGKKKLCIIHFTDEKPWETKNYHYPIEQIWWDYAKKTPFYVLLMERFVQSTMSDSYMEEWIRDLMNQVETSKEELAKSIRLSERLLGMISK